MEIPHICRALFVVIVRRIDLRGKSGAPADYPLLTSRTPGYGSTALDKFANVGIDQLRLFVNYPM